MTNAGAGRIRILAPSPSVPGAWTDPSGGHRVTLGLVHAVHLTPGFAKGHDRIRVLTEPALRHTREEFPPGCGHLRRHVNPEAFAAAIDQRWGRV